MYSVKRSPLTARCCTALAALVASVLICGCATSGRFVPRPTPPYDMHDVAKPEPRDITPEAEYFDKTITQQVKEILNLSRDLRILFGKRKEAYNTNPFGEVYNSAWFTNRHHLWPLSIQEIRRGPNTGEGPDTSGKWVITRAKSQGVTPGFSIRDARGDSYVIKFDPLGYPELASGAEVVSTKLFHAMGYNTPENYIAYFDTTMLELGPDVQFTDEKGRRRAMTVQDLAALFSRVEFLPDGRIRALASKYLSGKPLGPFRYSGKRDDDPNDRIPHQHRRELRGLRIIAAWLNHFDTKDGNSLDMYVTEDDRNFVRHYLIDFGATLGSASWGPNHLHRGHENALDLNAMARYAVTLGLYVHPWEKQEPEIYPSVGFFESELFFPEQYKPQIPNPAFENMTHLDGYWAAKVVMSFTDEQLAAAVDEGQYTDFEARAYLLRTLIDRRDKIGRLYLNRVNCLDYFRIHDGHLSFMDMALYRGVAKPGVRRYRYSVKQDGMALAGYREAGDARSVPLRFASPDAPSGTQWEVQLEIGDDRGGWGKWVRVYLEKNSDGSVTLLGVRRQN